MLFQRIMAIFFSPDGEPIFQGIRDHFSGFGEVRLEDHAGPLPDRAIAVGVFILTDQSVQDPSFADSLNRCRQHGYSIVPVVPATIQQFNFSAIAPELEPLEIRNALGWKSTDPSVADGTKVCEHLKAWLGLTLFDRDRKFFISYRRSDGETVALHVQAYFSGKGYRTFLDTEDIMGGDPVQPTIHDAISDRDFVLLIDSPEASQSKWIREEVDRAILNRIKVLAVRVNGGSMVLPHEIEVFDYHDQTQLPEVEGLLRNAITSTKHFDLRVEEAVRELESTCRFRTMPQGKRKVILSWQPPSGSFTNLLVEFEDAPHSLEALYRLYCGHENYGKMGMNVASAYFVHRNPALSGYSRKAVEWARGSAPLEVGTLDEFFSAMLKKI